MKAAVLYGPMDIRLEQRVLPPLGADAIRLRIQSAALCGTDLRMWKNGIPGNPPRVLGHEMAGVIAEIGSQVRGYAVGDKIAVAPNMGCGLCDQCVSGRSHMCPDYRALGIQLDGAFAEYVDVPGEAVRHGNVCKLGPAIGFAEAAAVEAFSCAYNGFEQYGVCPGDTVVIVGAGPIGLMHATLARMAGAAHVVLCDLAQERLALAQQAVPGILIYGGADTKAYLMELTNGRGADVCVTACPVPQVQAASLEWMALYGRVCFFGGLPVGQDIVPLNTNLIHYRQLTVSGTTRASLSQYRKCLQLVEDGVINLSPLITNHFTLDQINEAFGFVAGAGGLKSVIDFH